ncbi:hypothetical protein HII28_02175 [Planctomonas sp. JC2975]|uniref:hypothetical protein n=1 Tax=Planctomonas sp. JC2975 TaxID=2729626 RepID=UPI0014741E53|nr:hypothetical protein [Planctomonas sp. JC2975]NNC10694.1 hypothetical protein [Planctomonas sp. JC2975]
MADDDIRFEPAEGLDDKVLELPLVGASAEEIANRIAEVARDSAPEETGEYAAGITVQKTKTGARVFASDFKSAWLEFGVPSRGVPARFILRRAVEAAGYKFKKRS